MKFYLLSLLFVLNLYASGNLSLYADVKEADTKSYSIQVFSTVTNKTLREHIKDVPKDLQKKLYTYHGKKYFALRYASVSSPRNLQKALKKFKNAGFKDAYILNTGVKIKKKKDTKISKFLLADMILKANDAYKKGDEMAAMLNYEIIYAAGQASPEVINNLCYLYGTRGAWFDAKRIIAKQKYSAKYIYAYANGSALSNQKNFIDTLSPYMMIDRSGKLLLLAGYYFEKNNHLNRALGYYKMAYEKNPSGFYNIFAYARALDMEHNYEKAIVLYQKALNKAPNKNIHNIISERILQLKA